MQKVTIARWTALLGYFGLLILILNWFTWISPPTALPRALPLIALCVPLMFPLRGLLHGRPFTHSWTAYLSLLYFAIGVDVAFNRITERNLGLAMVLFSVLLFFGSVFFSNHEKKKVKAAKLLEESESAIQTAANEDANGH